MRLFVIALIILLSVYPSWASPDVPVIYDIATKHVKRWVLLDYDSQMSDPAFGPLDSTESRIIIPRDIYYSFKADQKTGTSALDKIQDYVNEHTQ